MDDKDLYSGLDRYENCFNLDNSTSKRRNITLQ
jgi:hypothetical protein